MPSTIDKRNLHNLAEWQLLRTRLVLMADDYMEEILELSKRGQSDEMFDRCGRVSMIKDILQMANELGGEKDADNSKREEDIKWYEKGIRGEERD